MLVCFFLKIPKVGYGMGRKAKLKKPISLDEAVTCVKQHLKLTHVRLAKAPGMTFSSILTLHNITHVNCLELG